MSNPVSSSHQNDRGISCSAEDSRAILTTSTSRLAVLLQDRERDYCKTIAAERTTADIHPESRALAGHSWATQS